MPIPPTDDDFVPDLRSYLRATQLREGDEGLRETLSVERMVTSGDHQMSRADKAAWAAALDQIEAELLPPTSSSGSPPPAAPALPSKPRARRTRATPFRPRVRARLSTALPHRRTWVNKPAENRDGFRHDSGRIAAAIGEQGRGQERVVSVTSLRPSSGPGIM